MPFDQFKIAESVDQTRGIGNKYIYESPDSSATVTAADYFEKSRFLSLNPENWKGGVIEASLSDGYFFLRISADGKSASTILINGGGSGIFTKEFISSEIALPGGSDEIDIPHSLGEVPKFVLVTIKCVVADPSTGSPVGFQVTTDGLPFSSGGSSPGVQTAFDGTNIFVTFDGSGPFVFDGNQLLKLVTRANWRIVARGWA